MINKVEESNCERVHARPSSDTTPSQLPATDRSEEQRSVLAAQRSAPERSAAPDPTKMEWLKGGEKRFHGEEYVYTKSGEDYFLVSKSGRIAWYREGCGEKPVYVGKEGAIDPAYSLKPPDKVLALSLRQFSATPPAWTASGSNTFNGETFHRIKVSDAFTGEHQFIVTDRSGTVGEVDDTGKIKKVASENLPLIPHQVCERSGQISAWNAMKPPSDSSHFQEKYTSLKPPWDNTDVLISSGMSGDRTYQGESYHWMKVKNAAGEETAFLVTDTTGTVAFLDKDRRAAIRVSDSMVSTLPAAVKDRVWGVGFQRRQAESKNPLEIHSEVPGTPVHPIDADSCSRPVQSLLNYAARQGYGVNFVASEGEGDLRIYSFQIVKKEKMPDGEVREVPVGDPIKLFRTVSLEEDPLGRGRPVDKRPDDYYYMRDNQLAAELSRHLTEDLKEAPREVQAGALNALVTERLHFGNRSEEAKIVDTLFELWQNGGPPHLWGADNEARESFVASLVVRRAAEGDPRATAICLMKSGISGEHQSTLNFHLEQQMANLERRQPGYFSTVAAAWQRDPAVGPALKEAARSFLEQHTLGIEYSGRFSPEVLQELMSNRQNPNRDDRPIATLVYAKSDHNGAFYSQDEVVRDLISQGFRVMYYEIAKDSQLPLVLEDAGSRGEDPQKTTLLLIAGHGSRTGIRLGTSQDESAYLDPSDRKKLARISNQLTADAQVILLSCSTGEGRDRQDNMANFFRRLLPNITPKGIFAPEISTNLREIVVTPDRKIEEVDFYGKPVYRADFKPILQTLREARKETGLV